MPPELAFVRACGPEVRAFATPIEEGTATLARPLDEVRRYGELALLQFRLVDPEEWRGPRADLYRALWGLFEPAPPPGLPAVLAALRVAAAAPRPEHDWIEGVWLAEIGSDSVPTGAVALAGALASHVRRGDIAALDSSREAARDALQEVLAGPFGTLLATPVLAAVGRGDPDFVGAVLAAREAPCVLSAALFHALFDARSDETFHTALREWHGDACRRWATWCDSVARGALLPTSFGADRWDGRELRMVAELSAENTARRFLAEGRFEEARSLLATVKEARRSPRIEILDILAELEVFPAEEIGLPPPGEERAALAARLEPHVDRLEELWDAQLDRFERRPGSGDVDAFADASLLLAAHHACEGHPAGGLDHVDTCCEHLDIALPAWAFYLSALALSEALDVADRPGRESPVTDGPAWFAVAAELRQALSSGYDADPDELAGLVTLLGGDPEAALARTADYRERFAAAVEDDRAAVLEEIDPDDPGLPGPLAARIFEWAAVLWLAPAIERVKAADGAKGDVDEDGIDDYEDLDLDDDLDTDAYGNDADDDVFDDEFDDEFDGAQTPTTWGETLRNLEDHYSAALLEQDVRDALDRRDEARVEAATRIAELARLEELEAAAAECVEVDPLAGDWDADRLAATLATIGNDADLAGRLADLLCELEDPALGDAWSDALADGGAARRALGDTQADLERLRVLCRIGRDDIARALATGLFWRAVNGTLEAGYDPGDFLLLIEELGAADGEMAPLRAALAGARDVVALDLPAEEASGPPVSVLFVGGNEIQAQYTREIDAELARHHGDRVTVQWFLTGWTARWGPEAERIESSYPIADAVVLMQFTRTQLGRRLRRSAGEAGLPWIACTGHGRGSLLRAIEHAVEVVDRARALR